MAEPDAPLDEVASRLCREAPCGDQRLVDRLREHARNASARGLVLTALTLLERALAEPPDDRRRFGTLLEAGEAATWAGRPDAGAHLVDAAACATTPTDRALALGALGRLHANMMRHVDAAALLDAALAELPADHVVRPTFEHLRIACGLQDVRLIERTLPSILNLVGDHRGAPPELVAVTRGLAAGMITGNNADILEHLTPVCDLPAPDASGWDVRAASMGLLLVCEEYDAVAAMASEAAEIGERTGIARAAATADGIRAVSAWARGQLDEALASGNAALARCEQMGAPDAALTVAGPVAMAHLDKGDDASARAVLERLDPADQGHAWTALVHTAWARYHLVHGAADEALRAIERGEPLFAALSPSVWSWRSPAVTALARIGRLDDARTLAAEELVRARALSSRRALGIALRDAASVAEGAAALELAEESVSVLRVSRAELELARSLSLLAQLVGDRDASHRRGLVDEALRVAAHCGASRLIEDVRNGRADVGEARPRPSLTRSEAEVADLAAGGLSNREIAARLHLSVATVKTHLVHVYAKLEVRNRVELANRRRSGPFR